MSRALNSAAGRRAVQPVTAALTARGSEAALAFARAVRAEGTLAAYARNWRQWERWCKANKRRALPATPEHVADWLAGAARDGRSVSRVRGLFAAILFVHRFKGVGFKRSHPLIEAVLAGIARTCVRPIDPARPLTVAELRRVVAAIGDDDVMAARDRAILLVGFWGALRRSEIAALGLSGASRLSISRDGLTLRLSGTKATAWSATVAIPRRGGPLCATRAVERYLAVTGLRSGRLFRAVSRSGALIDRPLSPAGIRHILKARFAEAGLAPDRLSAHSLRAGFITAAAAAGAPEHVIARTSRHRSAEVLRGYIRTANAFTDNAHRLIR